MAIVENPNERVLGANNLVVTSNVKEETSVTFTGDEFVLVTSSVQPIFGINTISTSKSIKRPSNASTVKITFNHANPNKDSDIVTIENILTDILLIEPIKDTEISGTVNLDYGIKINNEIYTKRSDAFGLIDLTIEFI